jgi:hypothetical protein
MPANPEILNSLNQHVLDKTGVNVLAGGPPTGGDKGKDGKAKPAPAAATPTTPPDKIPLPDYNNPQSRLNYTAAVAKKYNLPHGMGDSFTRFNEVPGTQTDTLTSRQMIAKTAPGSGLPAPLFYNSAMVEGMTGLYPYGPKNDVDYSGNEKFPVSGYTNFGLDTFSDAYPGLVKKGYLPADFNKQFVKSIHPARKGDNKVPVNSANFATAQSALQAKAAVLRDAQDQVNDYATKNKIPLSDKAKQFITLAYYNGGSGAGKALLQDFQREGLLKNDAFLTTKPQKSDYGKVYNNVMDRFKVANAQVAEGYDFSDPGAPKPAPQQQGPLFKTNKQAFVDSTLKANQHLDWVQRLYEKNAPSIQIKGQPDRSTHFMGDDGNGYVFPTVVRQNGKLVYLGDKAEDYARETKTGIQFPKEQGDWFANNGYKLGTNVNNAIGPNGVPFHNPKYVLQQ